MMEINFKKWLMNLINYFQAKLIQLNDKLSVKLNPVEIAAMTTVGYQVSGLIRGNDAKVDRIIDMTAALGTYTISKGLFYSSRTIRQVVKQEPVSTEQSSKQSSTRKKKSTDKPSTVSNKKRSASLPQKKSKNPSLAIDMEKEDSTNHGDTSKCLKSSPRKARKTTSEEVKALDLASDKNINQEPSSESSSPRKRRKKRV